MSIFSSEYGIKYDESMMGGIEPAFKEIKDSLFNLPFDQSAEEITYRFRWNLKKLKEYAEKFDSIANDLGINPGASSHKDTELEKLQKRVKIFSELATMQGNMLRKICGLLAANNPAEVYRSVSEPE